MAHQGSSNEFECCLLLSSLPFFILCFFCIAFRLCVYFPSNHQCARINSLPMPGTYYYYSPQNFAMASTGFGAEDQLLPINPPKRRVPKALSLGIKFIFPGSIEFLWTRNFPTLNKDIRHFPVPAGVEVFPHRGSGHRDGCGDALRPLP